MLLRSLRDDKECRDVRADWSGSPEACFSNEINADWLLVVYYSYNIYSSTLLEYSKSSTIPVIADNHLAPIETVTPQHA